MTGLSETGTNRSWYVEGNLTAGRLNILDYAGRLTKFPGADSAGRLTKFPGVDSAGRLTKFPGVDSAGRLPRCSLRLH